MRRPVRLTLAALGLMFVASPGVTQSQRQETLDVYYLDMEGGGGTLVVSPSGGSLLIDAGFPELRDAERILAVAKQIGLTQIDYFVATHFHSDHIGGVASLVGKLPIRTFVDHGEPMEPQSARGAEVYERYVQARDSGEHLSVRPGDVIPLAGIEVQVVTAGGALLETPLPGAEIPNRLCGEFKAREGELESDAGSVGLFIRYERFRAVQLGDLTFNKEHELICPNNVLGTVDVFQTSAHGLNLSSPPELVHALRSRVVVMNNAGKKGASRDTWRTVRTSPGLEDLWQVHYSEQRPGLPIYHEPTEQGGEDFNVPEQMIANVDDSDGHFIKLSASKDGSFVVTNSRTGFMKEYTPILEDPQ
jgi:beta-lactamase superfamily II metal-dependent hydrolase